MPSSFCEAAIGLSSDPQRSLYASQEAARRALGEELRNIRNEFPSAAEDVNGVLDDLEAAGEEFLTYFYVNDVEWTAWYRPSDDRVSTVET